MLDESKIYKSNNCGSFRIIKKLPESKVVIRFLDTGFQCSVRRCDAVKGEVKDKTIPSVSGVGFLGCGKYRAVVNGRKTKAYNTWKNMLNRCYGEGYHSRQPTYKECYVCDEWHDFQNFAEWFEGNHIEGYELDKDIKIDGNKTYSPETCTFVSKAANIIKANAKSYKFVSPDGEVVVIYNLRAFCADNDLLQSSMSKVNLGGMNQHKGWTKAPAQH